jgi:hypothetical protein
MISHYSLYFLCYPIGGLHPPPLEFNFLPHKLRVDDGYDTMLVLSEKHMHKTRHMFVGRTSLMSMSLYRKITYIFKYKIVYKLVSKDK